MKDDIPTIQEVAAMLKLIEKPTHRLASDGELLGLKVGGSRHFSRKELEK